MFLFFSKSKYFDKELKNSRLFHYLFCSFKVPGRLGLLITLDLIATNTYNSVKAPSGRGFSYIEIWLLGIQIPILLAIVEYGILLTIKRMCKKEAQETKIKVFHSAQVCKEHCYRKKAASDGENGRLSASCNFFSF